MKNIKKIFCSIFILTSFNLISKDTEANLDILNIDTPGAKVQAYVSSFSGLLKKREFQQIGDNYIKLRTEIAPVIAKSGDVNKLFKKVDATYLTLLNGESDAKTVFLTIRDEYLLNIPSAILSKTKIAADALYALIRGLLTTVSSVESSDIKRFDLRGFSSKVSGGKFVQQNPKFEKLK